MLLGFLTSVFSDQPDRLQQFAWNLDLNRFFPTPYRRPAQVLPQQVTRSY